MQIHMMTAFDVLGKIAGVRLDFLSQGKISDFLIQCARNCVLCCLLSCLAYTDGHIQGTETHF